jgi:hypothetical protein
MTKMGTRKEKGAERALPPQANASRVQEIINECQESLSDTYFELHSYGFVFSNLKNCEVSDDDLYGMGLVFNKMAKRISNLSARMSEIKVG